MEDLQLSDTEKRYYSDLFLCCEPDGAGKVTALKATELLRSSNLPNDVLNQILEIAGIAGGMIGQQPFFGALKLVAASQAGLSLQTDICSLEVPLPNFTWVLEQPAPQQQPQSLGAEPAPQQQTLPSQRTHRGSGGHQQNLVKSRPQHSSSPDLIQLSDTDPTPTPMSRPSEEKCPPLRDPTAGSPEASSTTSADSPTPTNSVQEHGMVPWANSAHHHWQGLESDEPGVSEEQRQLLGTEEESSDRHSSDEEDEPEEHTKRLRRPEVREGELLAESGGDEEDEEGNEEVWTITPEQREYYLAQFRALQPDLKGLLPGHIARQFFEKSRLPVAELRRIWQLSDVTKDGALTLDEFNTAMHLVVLRRNHIALPAELPPCLQPPLLVLASPPTPASPTPQAPPPSVPAPRPPPDTSPPSLSPQSSAPESPPRTKEWTKFVDSPTSSVSSPGPKPVNFDFHKVTLEQDPKILHPVPLRVTPEQQGAQLQPPPGEEEAAGTAEPPAAPEPVIEQTSPRRTGPDPTPDIRPIQRPQAKKPAALGRGAIPPPIQPSSLLADLGDHDLDHGSLSGPASLPMPQLGPPPTSQPPSGAASSAMLPPRKEAPPPPPRPHRTHTRSSSLDLNSLGKGSSGTLNAPPVVPPRVSPNTTVSPKRLLSQRSEGSQPLPVPDFPEGTVDGEEPRRHGAFEVYRKPNRGVSASRAAEEESAESIALTLAARNQHRSDPAEQSHSPVSSSSDTSSTSSSSGSLGGLEAHTLALSQLCARLTQELVALQEEHASLRLQLLETD